MGTTAPTKMITASPAWPLKAAAVAKAEMTATNPRRGRTRTNPAAKSATTAGATEGGPNMRRASQAASSAMQAQAIARSCQRGGALLSATASGSTAPGGPTTSRL